MNWLKRIIRAWLLTDSPWEPWQMPEFPQTIAAMEKKQREHHDELMTILHALEIQQANARPAQQQKAVQYIDWEQVQSLALKQLEDENKEN